MELNSAVMLCLACPVMKPAWRITHTHTQKLLPVITVAFRKWASSPLPVPGGITQVQPLNSVQLHKVQRQPSAAKGRKSHSVFKTNPPEATKAEQNKLYSVTDSPHKQSQPKQKSAQTNVFQNTAYITS